MSDVLTSRIARQLPEAVSARAKKQAQAGGAIGRRASQRAAEIARFVVKNGPSMALALRVAEVTRLALMSKLGDRCPPEISGHDAHGPLRHVPEHAHAFYLPEDADGDGFIDHVLIYCSRGFRKDSRRAMDSLSKLWMPGSAHGYEDEIREWQVALEVFSRPEDLRASRLVGLSEEWISVTPYLKPRYDHKAPRDFEIRVESYKEQILREWGKRFPTSPRPQIEAIRQGNQLVPPEKRAIAASAFVRTRNGRGGPQPDTVGAFFRLHFARPAAGPISLGKHAHFGLGLFERADTPLRAALL